MKNKDMRALPTGGTQEALVVLKTVSERHADRSDAYIEVTRRHQYTVHDGPLRIHPMDEHGRRLSCRSVSDTLRQARCICQRADARKMSGVFYSPNHPHGQVVTYMVGTSGGEPLMGLSPRRVGPSRVFCFRPVLSYCAISLSPAQPPDNVAALCN